MNKKNLNEKDTKNINIEQLLAVDLFDSKIFDQIDNFESIQKKDSQSDFITESLDGILKEGMQLSKIHIKNFKSIKDETFNINETTLLSGKNSAGKSSFTHAILLIAQWMGGYADSSEGFMPLNGELIQLGTTEDIYFAGRNEADRRAGFPGERNLTTYKDGEPIVIRLYFEQKNKTGVDREHNVTFKFLPEFRNLEKKEETTVQIFNSNKTFTNKGNFAIVKKPEIELVEFSSETSFINDEFKTQFVNNLLRSMRIRKDVEYLPNIKKYFLRKFRGRDFRSSQTLPLDEIPETLSILRKYKKFQVDSRKLNTKNFFGSYLTNFRNSHKFYFAPAKSSKMSIYSISTKYGNNEDYEYLISPNKLKIGKVTMDSDIGVNRSDEILLRSFTAEDYALFPEEDNFLTKQEQASLKKFLNGIYNDLSYQKIISGNNIAVHGKDLVQLRLISDIFNNIQSENSSMIVDVYFKKTSLETYKKGLFKYDEDTNKDFHFNELKIRDALDLDQDTKGTRRLLSDNKLDEFIWFLISASESNFNEPRGPNSRRGEFTRTWRRNDENNDDYKGLLYSASSRPRAMSRILPNKRSKELRDRFETTSKHKYIESLYDSIDSQMIEQFIFGSGPAPRGFDADSLNNIQRTNLRRLQDFMETTLETDFINEENRGWREYNRYDILSRLKLAGVDLRNLASNVVSLHCEFEKIMDNLVSILNKQSEILWKKLRSSTTVSTSSVPELSETIVSHFIKETINNIYDQLFDGDSEMAAIRKYYILKLCLPTISNKVFSELLIQLSNEIGDLYKTLENENFELNEKWTVESNVSGNNLDLVPFFPLTECSYYFSKQKKDDLVFVSVDKNLYELEQVPQTSIDIPFEFQNATFLSGVLSRNSFDTRSFVTPYTPIGFHGGKMASELYNKQLKLLSAPQPQSLEIFDNPKSRKEYLDNKGNFNKVGLNESKFLVTTEFKEHLNTWLRHLKLGDAFLVDKGDSLMDTRIRISQDRNYAKYDELYNLGSGVSQVLPILSHVLLSENKTIFLEEIEQNLHASAQALLADFILVSSLADNRRFVIETHSEHIINRIRLRTLQLAKPPYQFDEKNPFNIYFAVKGNKGTKLTQMRIDESGDFIDDYPEGFFDQAQLDILKIISEKN